MSPEEIRARYRDAKYKKEQIKILAECNLVSEAVIREILDENKEACESHVNLGLRKPPVKQRKYDWQKIVAAYRGCGNVRAVSEMFGIPYNSVWHIIRSEVYGHNNKPPKKESRS